MDFAYSDILARQRPSHVDDAFSRRHPKMSRLNRAKIFAPFAALSGFEAAVRAKETPYVPRRVRAPEEILALDRTLNRLDRALRRRERVAARAVVFEVCADVHHEAFGREGLYRSVVGPVRGLDAVRRTLTVGGRVIPFGDIDQLFIEGGIARENRNEP